MTSAFIRFRWLFDYADMIEDLLKNGPLFLNGEWI
jgi:hypothetical protein